MEVNQRLLESLPNPPDALIEPILFIRKVEKPKENGKVGHRIFLATIYGAYLYKSKFLTKKIQFDTLIPWDRVREIYSPAENEIILKYSDQTFHCRDQAYRIMLTQIMKNLVNVFLMSELPMFKSDQYIPSPDYMDKYYPQYKRFLFKCRANDRIPTPEFLQSFNKYTQDIKNNSVIAFNIGEIAGFEPYADLIFESLDVCNFIKILIIPETTEHNLWTPLANFIRRTNFITSIEIFDKISDGFNSFLQAIIQNPNSKIQSLLFNKSKVTSKQVSLLIELMRMKPIIQLGFNESVDNFYPIIKVFANNNQFQALRSLTITHVKGASAKNAIQHLPRLIKLDFSYNDVDITPTIKEIANTKNCRIREIYCDSNYCKMKPPRKMKLPKKFDKFIGTNIKWFGNNLLSFINIFSHNSMNPDLNVVIDLSNADIETEAKLVLFEKISKYPIPNLFAFKWEENPLHQGFFDFLAACKKLKYLSLSGCFSISDNSMDPFLKFISSNKTIKKLVVQGRENKKIGVAVGRILDGLVDKRIQLLDISNQCIQDDIFPLLKKFLDKNFYLESLYLDQNQFQNPDDWRDFVKYLKGRHIKMLVQLPHNDLKDLNGPIKRFKKRDLREFIADLKIISCYDKYSDKRIGRKMTKSVSFTKEDIEKAMSRSSSQPELSQSSKGNEEEDENSMDEIAKKMKDESEGGDSEENDDNQKSSSSDEEDAENQPIPKPQLPQSPQTPFKLPPPPSSQSPPPQIQRTIPPPPSSQSLPPQFSRSPPSSPQRMPIAMPSSPQRNRMMMPPPPHQSPQKPMMPMPPSQIQQNRMPAPPQQQYQQRKVVNYRNVGGVSWENVELGFINDSIWARNYKLSPADSSAVITQLFNREFALQRLSVALRRK
ncbi:Leucine Rich Repeat family protein [Trichomonas vaginalis G3]|uniref:Leucine Rich Repeat family protein n=1 Tax=Trichomonas vaginalis (strain ATCC PRA-98 / G3) TaxID=412133 RepID=A2DU86_TRIV3|nr:uncharacterized protein TVAGG3_0438200 [Trichomonas vaginalis G3]EAY16079.1 Leucine Rich Repeat family protein [Trichomonas vaginalis G3]KAI5537255.1 leucine-rich repeat, isoform f-related family [Trichomonas vaginalis G3]|eukprot:XP_001328302.1 hypothetical protein [Trichomonas vaginalis G3]